MLEHYGPRHLLSHSILFFQVGFPCIALVSNMQTSEVHTSFQFNVNLHVNVHLKAETKKIPKYFHNNSENYL